MPIPGEQSLRPIRRRWQRGRRRRLLLNRNVVITSKRFLLTVYRREALRHILFGMCGRIIIFGCGLGRGGGGEGKWSGLCLTLEPGRGASRACLPTRERGKERIFYDQLINDGDSGVAISAE